MLSLNVRKVKGDLSDGTANLCVLGYVKGFTDRAGKPGYAGDIIVRFCLMR
mgnify:FL=1